MPNDSQKWYKGNGHVPRTSSGMHGFREKVMKHLDEHIDLPLKWLLTIVLWLYCFCTNMQATQRRIVDNTRAMLRRRKSRTDASIAMKSRHIKLGSSNGQPLSVGPAAECCCEDNSRGLADPWQIPDIMEGAREAMRGSSSSSRISNSICISNIVATVVHISAAEAAVWCPAARIYCGTPIVWAAACQNFGSRC